jgi:hypothetical protein
VTNEPRRIKLLSELVILGAAFLTYKLSPHVMVLTADGSILWKGSAVLLFLWSRLELRIRSPDAFVWVTPYPYPADVPNEKSHRALIRWLHAAPSENV